MTVDSAEQTDGFPTYWELGLFFGSGALANFSDDPAPASVVLF